MEKRSEPYLRNLDFRGFVEGLTYLDPKTSQPLCHYFGGIPYALPPVGPFRFQKPRPLAPCFRYGTRANPGRYIGGCGVCPQLRDDPPPSVWEEDCLQNNIWIPIGEPPEGGWPVLFWIHGGYLQFGDANGSDLRLMLSETNCKAIVVEPAYRLNIFGFLASPELLDSSADFDNNAGFWDQRLALEWTWQNISYFGGNPSNITVGGYSAGSHSAFHQLAYDLAVPDEKSIIKRLMMLSNGPGMQPKSLDEAQVQFEELLQVLDIPLQISPEEKLAKLRAVDSETLIKATGSMKYHQFRGVTSGFVRHGLHREVDNGTFAAQMKRRGIQLIIGECADEHFNYATHHPPNSYESLFQRMQADYPLAASEVLVKEYYPDKKLPSDCKTWQEAWGRVYADIQIHQLERGMVNALVRHGAGDLINRYRIEWRVQACDLHWPREWGVTHGTDMAIWFWGDGDQISKKERTVIKRAFNTNLEKFLKGEKMDWGTEKPLDLRVLKSDGTVAIEEDHRLANGVKIWELLKTVGVTGSPSSGAKL